jgi:hypothetical protein
MRGIKEKIGAAAEDSALVQGRQLEESVSDIVTFSTLFSGGGDWSNWLGSEGNDITKTRDGGYILVAKHLMTRSLVVKLDETGAITWTRQLSSYSGGEAVGRETQDGGFMLSGTGPTYIELDDGSNTRR